MLTRLLGPDFRADAVLPEHILRYQRHMRDEAISRYRKAYSEHSIFSYTAALGEVFRWAFQLRYVEANPVTRANKIKPTRKQVHIYTPDEIRDMLDTVRGSAEQRIAPLEWPDRAGCLRWTAFFLTALVGPRVGEIWNLRWDDIDLNDGTLEIQSRVDRPGEYWRWTAKGKAERSVPLSDELWAVLSRLQCAATWRYPFLKECACRDKQAQVGRRSENQRKYPYNNLHRELKRILAVTNARRLAHEREPIRDGKFHTLRKNAATRLAETSVPRHFCQAVLGHASDRLTKEVYTYVDQRKCLDLSRQAFNTGTW